MGKKTSDIVAAFPGLTVIHQKIPSYEVGRHEHAEHEFFMPLQGEIAVQFAEHAQAPGTLTSLAAGPGKMLYVPPGLDHSFSSTARGSGERVIWLIEPKLWRTHAKTRFEPTAFPVNTLAKELLFYLLIHQKASGARHFVAALVESLAESLAAAKMKHESIFSDHIEAKVSDERIKKAAQLIDERLATISIGELASEAGMSLRNLNRLFLQETGLTPKDYLILRRIERAKGLLKEKRLTVTEISLEVGYGSLSKFIETFKRHEGMLPSDFRSTSAVRP